MPKKVTQSYVNIIHFIRAATRNQTRKTEAVIIKGTMLNSRKADPNQRAKGFTLSNPFRATYFTHCLAQISCKVFSD